MYIYLCVCECVKRERDIIFMICKIWCDGLVISGASVVLKHAVALILQFCTSILSHV